jgi:hypothetical protein
MPGDGTGLKSTPCDALQRVDSGKERRIEDERGRCRGDGHPLIALQLQHACELAGEKRGDQAALWSQEAREFGQRGVVGGAGEGIASRERAVPRRDDALLPGFVQARLGGLEHGLQGLRDRAHEQRVAHPRPLRADARGDQAGVGLRVGQFGALALEEGLCDLSRLCVSVRAVADLL